MAKRMSKMERLTRTIAKQVLDLPTLDTRKADDLDFKEQAVWNIKKALEDAYVAGYEAALKH